MFNNDSIDSVYHRESMANWLWSVEEEDVNYLNWSGYSDYFDLTWGVIVASANGEKELFHLCLE